MTPPERPSFREFLVSPAASQDAQKASKNAIFFALATAAYVGFVRPWDFGLGWLLIVPVLMFAVSIFLAVPVWFLRMAAAWSNWARPSQARRLTFLIDLIGLAAYLVGTYFALRALWFLVS